MTSRMSVTNTKDMCVTRVWVCEPSIGLHPALLIQRSLLQCLGVGSHTTVRTHPKCWGRFTHRRLKNILPIVLFISPNKMFVVFDYK